MLASDEHAPSSAHPEASPVSSPAFSPPPSVRPPVPESALQATRLQTASELPVSSESSPAVSPPPSKRPPVQDSALQATRLETVAVLPVPTVSSPVLSPPPSERLTCSNCFCRPASATPGLCGFADWCHSCDGSLFASQFDTTAIVSMCSYCLRRPIAIIHGSSLHCINKENHHSPSNGSQHAAHKKRRTNSWNKINDCD